jgi:hypothetical protein
MPTGSGWKNFTSASLTSDEVNGYLMSQAVMVFASSASRSAILVAPTEGMITYLKDTDVTQYYTGGSWKSLATIDNPGFTGVPTAATATAGTNTTQIATTAFVTTADNLKAPIASPTFTGIVKTNSPSFLIYTAGYNKAGSAWDDIGLLGGSYVVNYNNGSYWNSSTGLFTAPATGYYLFYAGGWGNYNGAGNRYAISFSINQGVGGDWAFISGANTSSVDSPLAMSPQVRYMTSGDYMRTIMFSAVAMQLGTSSHKFYYGGHFLG